jgi:hypothetical protein
MHPWAFAQERLRKGAKTTGTDGITPAFPAQWFTAYFALSPVSQLGCHRRFRGCLWSFPRNLAPAWVRQDHTTSLSASTLLVSPRLCVHRIPLHVRDDAYAPPEGSGTGGSVFLIFRNCNARDLRRIGTTGNLRWPAMRRRSRHDAGHSCSSERQDALPQKPLGSS